MQQVSALLGIANNLAGQNQASQGQFVKGNKTLQEFESVMANANSRDQVVSILLESQVFVPMKLMLKINILQFQAGTTIYNQDSRTDVTIDPVALRKAVLDFRISDGLIPASKLINGESFSAALQAIGTSPQIGQAYNIGPMFSYLMKTQGASIADFEKSSEQVAFEQALGQYNQLVALAIEKDKPVEELGPAPLPEQFGYKPEQNTPAPPTASDQSSAGTTAP